jgi:DNA-binding MarR family transcriptional regulator
MGAKMTAGAPESLIHVPARLRIVATLAVLPHGDTLTVTRLGRLLGLTPGDLVTHLRELEDAGYVHTEKTGAMPTRVTLMQSGRAALDRGTALLRQLSGGAARKDLTEQLSGGAARKDPMAPGPQMRIGDSDRDAAAAALGEHFAQGRLSLAELDERLGAAFTATTRGEISRATWDLPEVAVLASPPVVGLRRRRPGRGHRPGPAACRRTPSRHRGRSRGESS